MNKIGNYWRCFSSFLFETVSREEHEGGEVKNEFYTFVFLRALRATFNF